MPRPRVKNTSEYKVKQDIFTKNLFGFFLGLIQLKMNLKVDAKRDLYTLSRILKKNRLIVARWRNRENFPQNDVVFKDIAYRLLDYFNIPDFPISGDDLYLIDMEEVYGRELRKKLNLFDNNISEELAIREKRPVYMHSALKELRENPYEEVLMKLTDEEINLLSRVKFPKEFKITKELYRILLAYYRKQ